MRIRAWLNKLRKREDEAAIDRAEERDVETPAEQAASSGDIEGMAADERAARVAGEASIEDVGRLGDH